ncbi:MAG TPA: LuxR C-terminal-related transcriptional regulator [bacterium]|nr:LuxR C-terminal-related transcriptional regulator [bacterium]
MTNLPAGTVTFLFTDIEGSTRLLQRLGDQYVEALKEHRRLLRAATRMRDGTEVDTQGDAFFFVFARARDAVAAAVACQQAIVAHPWGEGITFRVRMGVHTGEPRAADGGYTGMDVHRAARVCSAAHGGQILLSDTTQALVARDLPGGVTLQDLGEHRLKDLAHSQRLFQVVAAGLPSDFPALRAHEALPNNLPAHVTSFIGREREIADVIGLLDSSRLLTLTGSGGAGKTRLALQVAAAALRDFADGVWMVELASLADPSLVPQTLASVLSVPEHPGRPLSETLVDALRHKCLLIVLDNCEHLQPACAQIANALVRGCPRLRILATSRVALGVPGETVWRTPSLSIPDLDQTFEPAVLQQYEAVQLFIERARSVQREFALSMNNAHAVARVCRELDGIPLALELAAARTRVLTVEQIATRLGDRFQLLTGGSSLVVPRHQTLQATMDWSYDLLSKKEQVLLRRLSVFAGGCTLEAAEAVCTGSQVSRADVLDLLTQLVDKSLVQVELHEGAARYTLLETVREYGRNRLKDNGETDEARRRHCDWYCAVAERAKPELFGPHAIAWLERLETDHDNFRGALEWCRIEPDVPNAAGLRLVVVLYNFLETRGHFAEVRQWLDEMLTLYKDAAPVWRARGLNLAGHLAYTQGDSERALIRCEEALALSRTAGDKTQTGQALHYLAHAAEGAGDYRRAAELFEQSVAVHRDAGSTIELGTALHCLANLTRLGPSSRANYQKAWQLFEEALAIFHGQGYQRGPATTLHNMAYLALREGDHVRARALFSESLVLAKEMQDRRVLNCIAGLAAMDADTAPERAARLFGAAETLMSTAGVSLEPVNRADHDHYVTKAKGRLGERAFELAWRQGASMTVDTATTYALAEDGAVFSQVKTSAGRPKLTAREREVAALVARGLTNREISSSLVIAERTVDAHVEHILNKLGVDSRTHIATWAVEQGLYKPAWE